MYVYTHIHTHACTSVKIVCARKERAGEREKERVSERAFLQARGSRCIILVYGRRSGSNVHEKNTSNREK